MTTQRATNLLAWIRQQIAEIAEVKRQRQDAEARRAELELLCGVEVIDSSWSEWEDTVAAFAQR